MSGSVRDVFKETTTQLAWSYIDICQFTTYQKSEEPFFEQWAIDEKSEIKVEKHPQVAKLKLKVIF